MNKIGKVATAFAAVAGIAYGATYMATGIGYFLTKAPETTAEFSDNGLRVLTHDYRAGYSGNKPQQESYALLLDTKEYGVVACHGLRSWPENTWAGSHNDGKYPDTLYANSPLFELVFKKPETPADPKVFELGSCVPYETHLDQQTIDGLAIRARMGRSMPATRLTAV